jgi:predicted dehydrogenase
MIAACTQYGGKLFVVKQNRFNVPVIKTRAALEEGRFGKLAIGTVRVRWCRPQSYYDQDAWRGTWAMDGGVLTNQASHHVDLLQWMMGDVESVSAKSSRVLARIEAEDTVVAVLKFKSGALGVIEATTAARPTDLEGSLSLLGEGGTVEIGGFAVNKMKVWKFAQPQSSDEEVLEKYSVNPPNVYGFGHQAYYEDVVRCLQSSSEPTVGGHSGKKSLELIHAIYEAVETGQEVTWPFIPKLSPLGKS